MSTLELKAPPPLVAFTCAALMWLASRALPSLMLPLAFRVPLSALLCVTGVGIALAGVIEFRRAHTTVDPLKPQRASSLVTTGIFRLTRNPMYLGLTTVLLGWAVFLSNVAALIAIPAFAAYITRFQIVPEERALSVLFGKDFLAYACRVRRWI